MCATISHMRFCWRTAAEDNESRELLGDVY